jgi:hypothetical protein
LLPPVIAADGHVSTNGQFTFTVNALAGTVVVIEASTNLMNWVPLETNSAGIGPLYFKDPGSSAFPHRFYRVRPAP